MSELRSVFLTLDGVTYRHGHRDAVQTRFEVDVDPDPAAAKALAAAALESLDGDDLQLKAGWLGLRWLLPDGSAWDGPAYLFAFESDAPGSFQLEVSGEDLEPWPLP
tara:strand:+ start:179 stop:499 length:321 start_codon:yes stop_codon:yes gene_type:complete